MATYTDFNIICGLSRDGAPVNGKETDWLHYAIPVQPNDIWEFQFQCGHRSGDPDATVIGSFVIYDSTGLYRSTTPGPAANLTDGAITSGNVGWKQYVFDYQFGNGHFYVFPAIWWHAATALSARYLAGVQVARIDSEGGAVVVMGPDIFLTLGTSDPLKELAAAHARMGP